MTYGFKINRQLPTNNNSVGRVTIVYDGECPVCSLYSRAVRIREDLGELHLVDARANPNWASKLTEMNINLDQGFALLIDDKVYHGNQAINILAMISCSIN